PRGALRPSADEAGRGEQPGEGERVDDGHERREHVAVGEHEDGTRTDVQELAEEERRRHEVAHDKRRLVRRNEGPDLSQRLAREWHGRRKEERGYEGYGDRKTQLAGRGRQGRNVWRRRGRQALVSGCHRSMLVEIVARRGEPAEERAQVLELPGEE